MFQRVGGAAYKANLNNTIALMSALGNPEKKFKTIHVAGTNGKGSTSHFVASILREKGLKVGLHTSPHLKDFRERIRIDGQMVPKEWVCAFVEKYKEVIERIQPSFFEMAVGMCFKYFEEQNVDIAVIEVGMGGRLDSTNIISPLASIITNISFDHMQFLGNTLEKIACEKAGIIKPNTPVVIGQTQKETTAVFFNKAKECNSPIYFADQEYKTENPRYENSNLVIDIRNLKTNEIEYKGLSSSLCGEYQLKNIITVLKATDVLNSIDITLTKQEIERGFANVQKNFTLLGRWQTLRTSPLTICDTGHNEDGLHYVTAQLAHTPYKHLHFVLGMVSDKDISTVLSLLPKENTTYYLCKADIPRGLDVESLAKKATQAGLTFEKCSSVKDALLLAQRNAKEEDLVFVGGSTYTVAEIV
jgi:folylpolyglutamate synthase/dihydrofolate synthase